MSLKSTGGEKLSPENITDVLLRAELYREIRNAQSWDEAPRGWTEYEVQPADTLMPELIAYKVYRLDTLKWVVLVAASQDDFRVRLEAGTTLMLPSSAWLQERIRDYVDLQKLRTA